MPLRPEAEDLGAIGATLGTALRVLAVASCVPVVVGAALGEWNAVSALVLGAALAWLAALAVTPRVAPTRATLGQALVAIALAWLLGAVIAAVPLLLSGHAAGPLAALFEAMSALTTTGATVLSDVDHLPVAVALHRHLLQVVGGIGVVLVALTRVVTVGPGVGSLAAVPTRDDDILPNRRRAVRFVLVRAGALLAVGTAALSGLVAADGVGPARALLHGVTLAASGLSTGGFALLHTSVAAHHSAAVEAVVALLMVAGAMSFAVHLALGRGHLGVVGRHLEVRTLALTTTGTAALALAGLALADAHAGTASLLRRGGFMVLAAATTTGLTTVPDDVVRAEWGTLAPGALVAAMAVGGMGLSTAGGIRAHRVGVVLKTLGEDVRRILSPPAAYLVTTYHADRRRILGPDEARAATTVLLLFLASAVGGAAIGALSGSGDVTRTLFASVSLAANAGPTLGVIGPGTPPAVLATGILQMWLGRLEFVAVLALVGWLAAVLRGRVRS